MMDVEFLGLVDAAGVEGVLEAGLWIATRARARGTETALASSMQNRSRRHRGFTLIELIVVLVVLTILAGGLLPALVQARAKRQRIACVGNLKQVGLSFRIFAVDHNDANPMSRWRSHDLTNSTPTLPAYYFRMMSNELSTPMVLRCPADSRKPATNWNWLSIAHVSYFIGLDAQETYPQMLLAGDRNLTVDGTPVPPGLTGITTNLALGWGADMHRHCGNAALGDGSVQQLTTARLREQVAHSGATTNWLAVP
jgi:prepilin-type N-terminal cleavage/methylation domain-containing protein